MRLGCCETARDKLSEARFFLQLLKRTKGQQPRVRFYASATMSAARSVTFVLQAELRELHREKFDKWWADIRSRLSVELSAFPLVRDSRNVAHKEGNRLFSPVVKRQYGDGPVSELRLRLDPISGGSLADASFEIRLEKQLGLTPLTEDALTGRSEEEINAIMETKLEIMKDLSLKARGDSETSEEWSPPV